ncbi:Gloeo Verruco repeat [Solimicrobium silvestre]|uniref:Gloeo Verruco repeat n=2 Tax=Solimicrobium silvestre TaxID=2099400 RepID=A0A2S9H422_9BURK|nr:Gloeo Verruco repeat [Solimicrobium silvestre]
MHANVAELATGTQLTLRNSAEEAINATNECKYSVTQPVATTPGIDRHVCTHHTPVVTLLYSFGTNGGQLDGSGPQAGLVQANDGNFYGTTFSGGTNQNATWGAAGTVFKITTDGKESIIYNFGASATDGALPMGTLVVGHDGNLYGTTMVGGAPCFSDGGCGTVFKMTPGGRETQLFSIVSWSQGFEFPAGLTIGTKGNFYGVTTAGGPQWVNYGCCGMVFNINTSGVQIPLYGFGDNGIVNDGNAPEASVIVASDGNLYGTTEFGGAYGPTYGIGVQGSGTVFRITPDGTESIIYSFGAGGITDGARPLAQLVQGPDGNLYGTTIAGGTYNQGTVFRISLNGTMTILYSFGTTTDDGTQPSAGLTFGPDRNMYGTTSSGGVNGGGTVYRMTLSGQEEVVDSFDGNTLPVANLVRGRDGSMYGTTSRGGSYGQGMVYKLTF